MEEGYYYKAIQYDGMKVEILNKSVRFQNSPQTLLPYSQQVLVGGDRVQRQVAILEPYSKVAWNGSSCKCCRSAAHLYRCEAGVSSLLMLATVYTNMFLLACIGAFLTLESHDSLIDWLVPDATKHDQSSSSLHFLNQKQTMAQKLTIFFMSEACSFLFFISLGL